jgi:hypothetical protein
MRPRFQNSNQQCPEKDALKKLPQPFLSHDCWICHNTAGEALFPVRFRFRTLKPDLKLVRSRLLGDLIEFPPITKRELPTGWATDRSHIQFHICDPGDNTPDSTPPSQIPDEKLEVFLISIDSLRKILNDQIPERTGKFCEDLQSHS